MNRHDGLPYGCSVSKHRQLSLAERILVPLGIPTSQSSYQNPSLGYILKLSPRIHDTFG